MELAEIPAPDDPAAALAAVVALRRLANQLEGSAVAHAIGTGWTWAQVGQALGVTPQAVHKKHAHRDQHANPKPEARRTRRTL